MPAESSTLVLHDFRTLPSRHRENQPKLVEWLASAHARAAVASAGALETEAAAALERRTSKLVQRFCSATNRISVRNFFLDDFSHQDWDRMRIFGPVSPPSGLGAGERSKVYQEIVTEAFSRFYSSEEVGPDLLMHVTCTGYVSPSGAQRLVSSRGWGAATRVVHAYHMGCYAALPSLRIAEGALRTGHHRADLVHTELCTLHLDPSRRSPEQVIIQSLFADGLIRYSTLLDDPETRRTGLALISHREEVVPHTENEVTWCASDHGMEISLSREVPDKITAVLRPFLERLLEPARLTLDDVVQSALFAIHPGGPRIIDRIRELLDLTEAQVAASDHILRNYGNMSSATLPHIWKLILEDPGIPAGRWIVSLAFGPGLTISAALLRKTGGPT